MIVRGGATAPRDPSGMEARLDCIVAGLGAAGSAALHHLAARGARVAGFDLHTPPHTHGSSHGETRMIREAYFEDPRYVPFVRRAYDLWHRLQAETGAILIEETGGVYAGTEAGEVIPGLRLAGARHGIPLRESAPGGAAGEWAWLQPDSGMRVIAEPRAGLLHPERCIAAHLDGAIRSGATVHAGEPVTAWEAGPRGVEVTTTRGRHRADRLILATGAWMTEPLAAAGVPLHVARQPSFWFAPRDPVAAASMPVWGVEFEPGRLLYGFPDRGRGLKVAIHDAGTPATPVTIDRTVHTGEVERIRRLTDRYLPGLHGELRETATCLYTSTADGHFVIDAHPRHAHVLLVSACSGHGFKFSSAVGEAAAQWMLDGKPALDLSPFALARFRNA